MSTTTNGEPQVELVLEPVRGRGHRYRVTARVGGQVLHLDTLDVDNDRSRRDFIQKTARAAATLGIELDFAEYNQLLIEQAATGGVTNGNSAGQSAQACDVDAVLAAVGIDVLGENDEQAIVLWVITSEKRWVVKSPARWPDLEMLQALGERGAERLWLGDSDCMPEGMILPTQLRWAVALAAARAPRISGGGLIGQGVSKIDDEFLVVNGATAFIYDGNSITPVLQPRVNGKILDFNAAKKWAESLDPDVLAVTPDFARQTLSQLRRHLMHWNWTHRADPDVAAALVAATLIQAIWTWRPLVSLIGGSDVGKSTLLEELLQPIFGSWTILVDRSTEAGLRQAIGHDFCPVILDEFDKYSQRAKVLEFFRTASRGGHVLRGTRDQTGRSFSARHIAWFAAIESGEEWAQDRNRRIRLELNPPTNRGVLTLPTPSELLKFGQQLAACALWAAPAAVVLADQIKSINVPGIPGRLIECFSVPAAMHAVLRRGRDVTAEVAAETLRAMITDRETLVTQGEPEQERLLQDVMSANIRVTIRVADRQFTEDRSVGQLLRPGGPPGSLGVNSFGEMLAAKGIMLYTPRASVGHQAEDRGRLQRRERAVGEQRLFIAHDVVKKQLLAGSRWDGDVQIDQLLIRLAGAERVQQRCGGGRYWGVSLPWPGCLGADDPVRQA